MPSIAGQARAGFGGQLGYNRGMLVRRLALLCGILQLPLLTAQGTDVLARIKDQAMQHSQAAEDVFYLADVFGPRFMDSQGYVKAGEWAIERLSSYGLSNAQKEYFTSPGAGWEFTSVSVEMLAP